MLEYTVAWLEVVSFSHPTNAKQERQKGELMTSKERHEARYQRRKQKREEKKAKTHPGKYDDIFSFVNLFQAFYSCKKGVNWKKSVQSYHTNLPINTLTVYETLKNRKFKPLGFLEFDIHERGKKRHIRALTIKERCIQKALCNKYLIPLLSKKLIYDNGASLEGKGTDFSLRRIKCHLQRHFRKHGTDGYILQYDFSGYFDNIDHDILLKMLSKEIEDNDIMDLIEKSIRSFGEKGLGLGSQMSQIFAIFYPNIIDKYFKETMKVKGYGRYMDDGYMICKDKEEVQKCKEELYRLCEILNIKINEKKLKVTKLKNTFVFLKKRITLTETGKVYMKLGKESITRARRKLKKLFRLHREGRIKERDIYTSFRSWYGMSKKYDNYYASKNYMELFKNLRKEHMNG